VAEDTVLIFGQGFGVRYAVLTSENQIKIFPEDGKKMGQSPFFWEFPAKENSYAI